MHEALKGSPPPPDGAEREEAWSAYAQSGCLLEQRVPPQTRKNTVRSPSKIAPRLVEK
jgi:hypothetical protein